jgi:hypothetical protein
MKITKTNFGSSAKEKQTGEGINIEKYQERP